MKCSIAENATKGRVEIKAAWPLVSCSLVWNYWIEQVIHWGRSNTAQKTRRKAELIRLHGTVLCTKKLFGLDSLDQTDYLVWNHDSHRMISGAIAIGAPPFAKPAAGYGT